MLIKNKKEDLVKKLKSNLRYGKNNFLLNTSRMGNLHKYCTKLKLYSINNECRLITIKNR